MVVAVGGPPAMAVSTFGLASCGAFGWLAVLGLSASGLSARPQYPLAPRKMSASAAPPTWSTRLPATMPVLAADGFAASGWAGGERPASACCAVLAGRRGAASVSALAALSCPASSPRHLAIDCGRSNARTASPASTAFSRACENPAGASSRRGPVGVLWPFHRLPSPPLEDGYRPGVAIQLKGG